MATVSRAHRSPAFHAWTLRGLGESATFTARYDLAILALTEANENYGVLSDRSGSGSCLQLLGHIALKQRRFEEAYGFLDKGGGLFLEVGDKDGFATTLCSRAELAMSMGQHELASALVLEARQQFVASGNQAGEVEALMVSSDVQIALGRLTIAAQHLDEAQPLAHTIGDPRLLGRVWYHVGGYLARFGDVERAEVALMEAMKFYLATDHRAGQAQCHEAMAAVATRQGDHRCAIEHLEKSRDFQIEQRDKHGLACVLTLMGSSLTLLKRYGEAIALFRESIEMLYGLERAGVDRAMALVGLGDAMGRNGDIEGAFAPFCEARAILITSGNPLDLFNAYLTEGETLIVAGREDIGRAFTWKGLEGLGKMDALANCPPEEIFTKRIARINRSMMGQSRL